MRAKGELWGFQPTPRSQAAPGVLGSQARQPEPAPQPTAGSGGPRCRAQPAPGSQGRGAGVLGVQARRSPRLWGAGRARGAASSGGPASWRSARRSQLTRSHGGQLWGPRGRASSQLRGSQGKQLRAPGVLRVQGSPAWRSAGAASSRGPRASGGHRGSSAQDAP